MKSNSILAAENRGQFTKMINSFVLIFVCTLALVATSCQDEDVAPSGALPKPTTIAASPVANGPAVSFTSAATFGTVSLDGNGVYSVENFFQGTPGTGTDPHVPNSTYYYRADITDGGTSTNYLIRFAGTANGDITVASGWTLSYTATAFNSVTGSTSTTAVTGAFGYNNISAGTPTSWGVNTLHPGWYNYDITNHVVYPLADNGGSVTLVIANPTTGVKYKLELQDIYQNGTPNGSTPPNNYPYFKFRYKQL